MTVIVEAEPVDHRTRVGEAEDAGLRVALLRKRGHRADLDEAEPEPQRRIRDFGVLVVTRGQSQGVGEGQARDLRAEARIDRPVATRNEAALQRLHRQAMRALGVELEEERAGEPIKTAHRMLPGNTCRPSGPIGRSAT